MPSIRVASPVDLDGNTIDDGVDPVTDDALATKGYVDTHGGGGSGGGPGSGYTLQDYEKAGAFVYVGYKNTGGAWFIYRRTVASNVWQQAAGASAYSTAWTGRAGLTYA